MLGGNYTELTDVLSITSQDDSLDSSLYIDQCLNVMS